MFFLQEESGCNGSNTFSPTSDKILLDLGTSQKGIKLKGQLNAGDDFTPKVCARNLLLFKYDKPENSILASIPCFVCSGEETIYYYQTKRTMDRGRT